LFSAHHGVYLLPPTFKPKPSSPAALRKRKEQLREDQTGTEKIMIKARNGSPEKGDHYAALAMEQRVKQDVIGSLWGGACILFPFSPQVSLSKGRTRFSG
jgi:hypothetical protein